MQCPECWHHVPAQSAFCNHCGHELARTRVAPQQVVPIKQSHLTPRPTAKWSRPGSALAIMVWLFVAIICVGAGVFIYDHWPQHEESSRRTQSSTYEPKLSAPARTVTTYLPPTPEPTPYIPPAPPPHDVANGIMQVDALTYRYIAFTVVPSSYQSLLVGRFNAAGGQNDINVVVIPAAEMSNFQDFRIYRQFYNSGYITTARVKVPLPPGDYYLIFNNRRALLTAKTVEAYFELRYQ